MPKRFLFTQIALHDEYQHVAYHWVSIPSASENDFYRQATSLNAFAYNGKDSDERLHKRNWCHPGVLFHVARESEVGRPWSDPLNPAAPVIEHNSIWDFYDYIGYDYHSKGNSTITDL